MWWRPRRNRRGRKQWTSLGIVRWYCPLLALASGAGWLSLHYGAPLERLDLERLYLYLVAFVLWRWRRPRFSWQFRTPPGYCWLPIRSRFGAWSATRERSTAGTTFGNPLPSCARGTPSLALALSGRARRLSRERQAGTMHRAYLYLLALFGAMMAVIAGGMLWGRAFGWSWGWWTCASPLAVRELQASVSRGRSTRSCTARFGGRISASRPARRWTV